MTKFWMVTMIAILALGTTTGCPDDGGSCSDGHCDVCGNGVCGDEEYASGSCPEDCGYGYCGDYICEEMGPGRETCATCPSDCHTGCGSDADADSDAETDTTEDGTTDESTSCPACPNVAGEWQLVYYSNETGVQWINSLHLDQNGTHVTGRDEDCEYSGTISEDGTLSLTGDCPPDILIVTADASAYFFLHGTYSVVGGSETGTWGADRR